MTADPTSYAAGIEAAARDSFITCQSNGDPDPAKRWARVVLEFRGPNYLKRAQALHELLVKGSALALERGGGSDWQCTCHPDDNPPVPCAQKFALSECLAAAPPPPVPAQAESGRAQQLWEERRQILEDAGATELDLIKRCRELEGEVARLREVKDIRDGITDALEAAGYFYMSNAEGVASICGDAARAESAEAKCRELEGENRRLMRERTEYAESKEFWIREADRLARAAQAARDALEPFKSVAEVADFYVEHCLPREEHLTFPRDGMTAIDPEGPPQVALGLDDFRRAREALASLASVLDGGEG